jgi:hypothetical protein
MARDDILSYCRITQVRQAFNGIQKWREFNYLVRDDVSVYVIEKESISYMFG